MPIHQFRYGSDNLSYLIYGEKQAVVIDGGAVTEILAFVMDRHLSVEYIINTHSHSDHISGDDELLYRTKANYLNHHRLIQMRKISFENLCISVHSTPGHTHDSKTFFFEDALITGDTIFNGTVGNCFSEDLGAFFRSISFLLSFPPKTLIYAGHDYVLQSLKIASMIEPKNQFIYIYRQKYNPHHICYTLEDEMKVNPYLRFNTESMLQILRSKGLPTETAYERWESTYSLG